MGDLLSPGALGRTDLPRGNKADLLGSIRSRIFTLPGDTRIYPGRGPVTTVARERDANLHFLIHT